MNKFHELLYTVLDTALGEALAHLDQSAFEVRALLDNSLSIKYWFRLSIFAILPGNT
jgi:hypothetical protein